MRQAPLVIRGACVMTMNQELGDIRCGDVLIVGQNIAAVGSDLGAPGAETIDGRGMIVMPGLIDAHTHLWTSQMRGHFGSTPETAYFKVRNRLGDAYCADDMYHGTRLGATEAIWSGITTVVDFCHNLRGNDYVVACLRALRDTGIRARFLFGASTRSMPGEAVDLAALETLHTEWQRVTGGAPLTLGLAWRGPHGITSLGAGDIASPVLSVAREEFAVARHLSLPIAVHVSGHTARTTFEALVENEFLASDVQLVHFSNASAADIALAARTGTTLALTPLTELRVGYGITQLRDYLDGGMRVGLGIDSNSLAGGANMFTVMKLFQLIENGRLGQELGIGARRLLELATIDGARSLGLDAEIGSVEAGKRADLIIINPRALNMGMLPRDPAHLLVEATQPANVDTVIVDGRILKRNGELAGVDPQEVMRAAESSITGILHRAQA
jgi:5-methylthioadenosine/S-adenosylhomocysteine deaminase